MSQRLVKLATSLQQKKYRNKEQLFIAEGEKLVLDLLPYFKPKYILCDEEWATNHSDLHTTIVDARLLQKASLLKTTSSVIGLFEIPNTTPLAEIEYPILILDRLQDPGNLGTIVRTAAWFGIQNIVCSPDTVDIYSPKVVQATMGALGRVNVHYTELPLFLSKLKEQNIDIIGTYLEGENIYQAKFTKNSAVIIGNEGKGISEELKEFVSQPIHIPAFGKNPPESLNASVSAAIVCSELAKAIQN